MTSGCSLSLIRFCVLRPKTNGEGASEFKESLAPFFPAFAGFVDGLMTGRYQLQLLVSHTRHTTTYLI